MADITVATNGTINGTSLVIDGTDITKNNKVVSISMYASAPYKSNYSGNIIEGSAYCSYEIVNDNGTIERKSYGTSDTPYSTGIGTKIKVEDSIIRFVGREIDSEHSNLIDRIIDHCEKTNIKVPIREVLSNRSMESLKDKAIDIGMKLEDKINK